jgi:hypothetical protein
MNDAEIYEEARAAFEKFAAMGPPYLPGDPLSALQVQLCRWQSSQFGVPDIIDLVAGVIEEVGEFIEADTTPLEEDAIADALIFASQLATLIRCDFSTLWAMREPAGEDVSDLDTFRCFGRLCHIALKAKQKIRGYDDREKTRRSLSKELRVFYGLLDHVATERDVDPIAAMHKTVPEVVKRVYRRRA